MSADCEVAVIFHLKVRDDRAESERPAVLSAAGPIRGSPLRGPDIDGSAEHAQSVRRSRLFRSHQLSRATFTSKRPKSLLGETYL